LDPQESQSRLTGVNDDYPTCERTYAELRIYGSFDPDEISQHLELKPSLANGPTQPKPGYRERPSGWFLSSEGNVDSRDLRRHLDWVLERVGPKRPQLRELQLRPGITMTMWCVWWSALGGGGPTLWPEQMEVLGRLNLECTFEFAFYGDDES